MAGGGDDGEGLFLARAGGEGFVEGAGVFCGVDLDVELAVGDEDRAGKGGGVGDGIGVEVAMEDHGGGRVVKGLKPGGEIGGDGRFFFDRGDGLAVVVFVLGFGLFGHGGVGDLGVDLVDDDLVHGPARGAEEDESVGFRFGGGGEGEEAAFAVTKDEKLGGVDFGPFFHGLEGGDDVGFVVGVAKEGVDGGDVFRPLVAIAGDGAFVEAEGGIAAFDEFGRELFEDGDIEVGGLAAVAVGGAGPGEHEDGGEVFGVGGGGEDTLELDALAREGDFGFDGVGGGDGEDGGG